MRADDAGLRIRRPRPAGLGYLVVFEVPAIGFFHPVNALLIFALSGLIAHQAWRGRELGAAAA